MATLIVRSFEPLLRAYAALGLRPLGAPATVGEAQALAWGHSDLAACPQLLLGVPHSLPLLRLIEHPNASTRPTRWSHGWLALEILVRDVDALAAALARESVGFELVGPPADLDVSPAIRAMQVQGPAGEMLYLTQVKAPVPPFEIPLSAELPGQAALGPLFIAVMSTPSRADTLGRCAPLGASKTLQFDTKITVLNRALGHDIQRRWPVATTQFAGQSLFEIDEVQDLAVTPAALATSALPCGLAWVTMVVPQTASTVLFEVSPGAWIEPVPG